MTAAPLNDTNEHRLVLEAQAGNTHAFGELVLAYQRFVFNLAYRALGDMQEAQDATQETFLRAWLALPKFRAEARFSTWLYRIAVNFCYNRRPRLRRELAELPIDEAPGLSDDCDGLGANPLNEVEKSELRAFIHRQIDELQESYRLIISLRYQEELSYEEIAQVLNMPLGTVKTGLFRAKAQLRAALERKLPPVLREQETAAREVQEVV